MNYGHVSDTLAPDGESIAANVSGVFAPIGEFTGLCIARAHRLNDDDDNLAVAPEGGRYRDEQFKRR